MHRYLTQFQRVKVNALFSKGGNLWLKRSTRTAEILTPEEHAGVWGYFRNREPVEITHLDVLIEG